MDLYGVMLSIGLNPEKDIGWVGLAEPGWFELSRVAPNWDESHLNPFGAEPSRCKIAMLWLGGWLSGWR